MQYKQLGRQAFALSARLRSSPARERAAAIRSKRERRSRLSGRAVGGDALHARCRFHGVFFDYW
jgi:hypothetical protein